MKIVRFVIREILWLWLGSFALLAAFVFAAGRGSPAWVAFAEAIGVFAVETLNFVGPLFLLITFILILATILGRFVEEARKNTLEPSGIDFLREKTPAELEKYHFLFWFPIQRSFLTRAYTRGYGIGIFKSATFDQIPRVTELLENGVLSYRFLMAIGYRLEIKDECYHFMKAAYGALPDELQEQFRKEYSGSDFSDIFRKIQI
jgi:hypothetical protein